MVELGDAQATVWCQSFVEVGWAEPNLAAKLGHGLAGSGAVQEPNDLLLALLAGSHVRHSPKSTDYSRSGWYGGEGVGHRDGQTSARTVANVVRQKDFSKDMGKAFDSARVGAGITHVSVIRRNGALRFDLSRPNRNLAGAHGDPAAGVCRRRSNIDPPCRFNIDPGMDANRVAVGCG